jgi:hypothetical protein
MRQNTGETLAHASLRGVSAYAGMAQAVQPWLADRGAYAKPAERSGYGYLGDCGLAALKVAIKPRRFGVCRIRRQRVYL